MWLFAQASDDGNLAALTALVTALASIGIGATSLWRGRHSDQRDEITQLWAREEQLVSRVDALAGKVDSLRHQVERCEEEKSRLSRELAELRGLS